LRSNLIWRDKPAVSQSHTSLSGCSVSGPLFAFFAASWLDSCPAFGFAPLVPLRCSACFLFSAASSAARRGFTGLLSFPPPPLSFPSVRVVPITWCPPSSVPDFEQSAPIRVGDRGKKVNNVDPSHRSPSTPPASQPQVTCFLCPRTEIVMKYIVRVTVHTTPASVRRRFRQGVVLVPSTTSEQISHPKSKLFRPSARHESLPQLSPSRPVEPRFQTCLLHLPLDTRTEQQAEHGQQEQGYNKLVPGRVPLEATCLYVPFLPCSSVRVGISKRGAGADRQILVETPLLRARQTWLARSIWKVQMKDLIVGAKTHAFAEASRFPFSRLCSYQRRREEEQER